MLSTKSKRRIVKISSNLVSKLISSTLDSFTRPLKIPLYSPRNLENHLNVRDDFRGSSEKEMEEYCNETSIPHAVLCFNLAIDLNIGCITRTAHLLGMRDVYIIGYKGYNKKSGVGAHHYINVHRCGTIQEKELDVSETFQIIKELSKKYTLVCVEQGGEDLRKVSKESVKPFLFVMGSESDGIPKVLMDAIKKEIDDTLFVEIPQRGVLRSYNVSTAFSIVAWEFTR